MRKDRNINLDIIRCIAVISVIAVHFFKNIDFYEEVVIGKRMCCMLVVRNLLMICVPLFIILTGYLMCKKELSKKYYKGIGKTIEIYVLAEICILFFKKFYLKEDVGVKSGILGILGVTTADYSWYVEMYIGLFILIPFLNVLYAGLKLRKEKVVLIFTFLLCTTIPSLFNIFGWSVFPDWWIKIYPFTYYFIGAYIREYPPKMGIFKNAIILILTAFGFGVFGVYRSYGDIPEWAAYNDWGGVPNVVNSILVVMLILQIKTEKIPRWIRMIIMKISELSFGIYLLSYILDVLVYAKLRSYVPEIAMRMEWIIVTVPLVFIGSTILSQVLHWIVDIRKRSIGYVRLNVLKKGKI